ncbi:MAG: hypothetical protein HY660_02105 [Armatimonadetes bacterium]|nr:hypothetical protein [Armatimonadota bacterium]
MVRHRLYRQVDDAVTVLSLDLDDLFVLTASFIVIVQVVRTAGAWLGWVRLQMVVALVVTTVGFWAWRRLKARLPRFYLRHLLQYLAEADAYIVTVDYEALPLLL